MMRAPLTWLNSSRAAFDRTLSVIPSESGGLLAGNTAAHMLYNGRCTSSVESVSQEVSDSTRNSYLHPFPFSSMLNGIRRRRNEIRCREITTTVTGNQ
jgi:hypothetical protein